jgi:hypothetical protein
VYGCADGGTVECDIPYKSKPWANGPAIGFERRVSVWYLLSCMDWLNLEGGGWLGFQCRRHRRLTSQNNWVVALVAQNKHLFLFF